MNFAFNILLPGTTVAKRANASVASCNSVFKIPENKSLPGTANIKSIGGPSLTQGNSISLPATCTYAYQIARIIH